MTSSSSDLLFLLFVLPPLAYYAIKHLCFLIASLFVLDIYS